MSYEVVQRVCPPLKLKQKKPERAPAPDEKMLRHAPQNKDAAKQRRNK